MAPGWSHLTPQINAVLHEKGMAATGDDKYTTGSVRHSSSTWCQGGADPPSVLVCCLQLGERRMKRTEIVTKLIAGTAAFYLGKKVIVAPGFCCCQSC